MNTFLWYSFFTLIGLLLLIGVAVAAIGLLSLLLELWDGLAEDWKDHKEHVQNRRTERKD